MLVDRRLFLQSVAAALGGLTLRPNADVREVAITFPNNSLVPYLKLLPGYEYSVLSTAGEMMSDGIAVPPLADGMCALSGKNGIRILRNHEVGGSGPAVGRFPYDGRGRGAVTTLDVDPVTRVLGRQFLTLSGTTTNCSGGRSLRDSWITCEESTAGPALGFAQPHGYCFEVRGDAESEEPRPPIRAMGRYKHEAIAFDPATGTAYLTEDSQRACLYRYNGYDASLDHGKLEALCVTGEPGLDMNLLTRRNWLPVSWLEVKDPDPPEAEFIPNVVAERSVGSGAACFPRLEGCTFTAGRLLFTATNGGRGGIGQVWEYIPTKRMRSGTPSEGGYIRLLIEAPDSIDLHFADNVSVSPLGRIILCEDAGQRNRLVAMSLRNESFVFAENMTPGYEHSEFTGACYSPDGRTLFVNIQLAGVTLAIFRKDNDLVV